MCKIYLDCTIVQRHLGPNSLVDEPRKQIRKRVNHLGWIVNVQTVDMAIKHRISAQTFTAKNACNVLVSLCGGHGK